jgi:hypothetical protein
MIEEENNNHLQSDNDAKPSPVEGFDLTENKEALEDATDSASSYPKPEINTSEIKAMEVHHHPQVEKKSFKEYLLEGLMIFLAVSMGFIAENIREHLVNKEKEKRYMESMLVDLKKDTAEVRQMIYLQNTLITKMDSALSIPVEKLNNIDVQDTFYHHFIYFYGWEWTFTRYDNTISQLKNAGGFSILQNKKVVDSISNLNITYEGNLNFIAEHFYVPRWQRLDEFAMQLFILPEVSTDYKDVTYNSYLPHKEILLRHDKALLEQLYSFIRFEKGDIDIIKFWEEQYLNEAIRLIELIKKEYHLENE